MVGMEVDNEYGTARIVAIVDKIVTLCGADGTVGKVPLGELDNSYPSLTDLGTAGCLSDILLENYPAVTIARRPDGHYVVSSRQDCECRCWAHYVGQTMGEAVALALIELGKLPQKVAEEGK